MKYNEELWDLLSKYINWAKFDWALLYIDDKNNIMVKDNEYNATYDIFWFLEIMYDNGMLDECYSQEELIKLRDFIPYKELKKEIEYYIKEN